MKRNIIFGALLAVMTFVSCSQKLEYKKVAFAAFDSKSFSVNEDAGSVKVDLSAYNIESACNVTVSFGGTAKSGEHYTVSGIEGGVLNFTKSETKTLTFNIIDHPNEYLGNQTIVLGISSVSDGMEIGAIKSLTITILDNDIPVNWDFVTGKWTAQDYDEGQEDGSTYSVSITKVDDTHITLTNLWGGGENLEGTIAFDSATNSATIEFAARQVVTDASAYGYGKLLLLGQNESGAWAFSPVIAKVTSGGISIGPWNMVITAGTYAGYLYGGSYQTVLTK